MYKKEIKMGRVIFIDKTRPYYTRPQRLFWAVVAILIVGLLFIIAFYPDWVVVPPKWKAPTNVEHIK